MIKPQLSFKLSLSILFFERHVKAISTRRRHLQVAHKARAFRTGRLERAAILAFQPRVSIDKNLLGRKLCTRSIKEGSADAPYTGGGEGLQQWLRIAEQVGVGKQGFHQRGVRAQLGYHCLNDELTDQALLQKGQERLRQSGSLLTNSLLLVCLV